MNVLSAVAAFGLVFGAIQGSACAGEITGVGATFPYPIYAKWGQAYKQETGVGLVYQAIGSGAGVKQIQGRTVTFGASDAPLKQDELEKSGLVQFPTILGGIVPVVNVEGASPGQLTLDGELLARIFIGDITLWNDPAIQKLNVGLALPDQRIIVVHRADSSGTTFNFTHYLTKVSVEWKVQVGFSTVVEWLAGVGANGNDGVATKVMQTKGAIGYVEFNTAKKFGLSYTKMINAAGNVVSPGLEAFAAAASNARWADTPNFGVILSNQPGNGSWPMTAASFILIPKHPEDPKLAGDALKFFAWAFAKGGGMAQDLSYVPLPDNVVRLVETSWAEVKGADGKPVLEVSR
jgi:phosphate transport system substrate-binding protein